MVTFRSQSGRMRIVSLCLGALALCSVAGSWARAEFVEYPQYRYISGLPGNGYGVTADGQVGWDGAMSQCIPLGYTPSNGSVAVSYVSGSRTGGFKVGFSGKDTDGTLPITVGFGPKGHGVALTADFVDNEWDIAMHAQGQLLKETKSRPAVSVGVLDWANRREAVLRQYAQRGARSVFIAATKEFDAGGRPLHVTLGVGTNRFGDGPFVGACYDAHDRVKVMAEYDGLGFNAGAAAQLLPQKRSAGLDKQEGPGRADALNLVVGVADMAYPMVGLTYARKGVF